MIHRSLGWDLTNLHVNKAAGRSTAAAHHHHA